MRLHTCEKLNLLKGIYDNLDFAGLQLCKSLSFIWTIVHHAKLPFVFQDVSASLSKRYPELYKEGIRNMFFKWRVVAVWAFFAFYQSLIFYYFTTAASKNGHNSSGKTFGLWDVSTMAFTCIVVTVNLRLLLACNSITRWHYISVLGSIVAWFVFIFVYSGVMTPYDRQVSSLTLLVQVVRLVAKFFGKFHSSRRKSSFGKSRRILIEDQTETQIDLRGVNRNN